MRPLLWLRLKLFRGTLSYWLRLIDYDTNDRDIMNRAYGVYLVLFMVWWTAAMWAIAANFIAGIGSSLPPSARQQFVAVAPPAVFAGLIVLTMLKLRSSPYKLTTPDLAYVAGSPVQRAVPVALGFLGDLALPLVLSIAGVSFLAVALAQPLGVWGAVAAAGRSAVAIIPVIVFTWGVAWLAGLARMVIPGARRIPGLWLLPILPAAAAAFAAPGLANWPSAETALIVTGQSLTLDGMAPLAIAAAAVVAAVAGLGAGINMIDVADESLIWARLKEIGNLRWLAPSVYGRTKRQLQAAARKPILHLPETTELRTLVMRSALTYIRNPLELLKSLVVVVLAQGALIMLAYQLPALLIVVLLYLVAVAPTGSLTRVFSADTDDPFLRQFLPLDSLRLLMADTAAPTGLAAAISAVLWLLQPITPATFVPGLALAALLPFILALCRGASLLPLVDGRTHVSYGVLAVVSVGVTVGAGLLLGGMMASAITGALAAVVLASLIKNA